MSTEHVSESVPPTEKKVTMRNHWFEHVAKTRRKLTRVRKVPVTHREAMREASTWSSIKDRVRKRWYERMGLIPELIKKREKKHR